MPCTFLRFQYHANLHIEPIRVISHPSLCSVYKNRKPKSKPLEEEMADRGEEYGRPVRVTDEYGNPVNYPGGTMGSYGTTEGYGDQGYRDATTGPAHGGVGTGTYAGEGHQQQHHGLSGMLHRSGSSSSSSSSEDDGHGGRRKKKGLKEKILGMKEHPHGTSATTTTTPGAGGYPGEGYTEHHEKKGIMDKIKEKLPGHH